MWATYSGESLSLRTGIVHLWRAHLIYDDNKIFALQKNLSADELSRANQLIKKSDQIKFMLSKIITRQILAYYLDISPKKIVFSIEKNGKPFIANDDLQFNISHSGDYFLMGITKKNSIGVDIEYRKNNQDFLALAKRFFAAAEYQAIKNLPAEKQMVAFYCCWTRKEAFIKATGLGLSFSLSDFEVDVSESLSERSGLLQVHQKFSAHDWELRSLSLNDLKLPYFAAFAVRNFVKQVFCWNFLFDSC